MDKIQLIFFFISGFLVSRLIIKARLPHKLVYWLVGKQQLSLSKILFYLVAIAALLSFFIPNAITVLTLLPILELLRRSYEASNGPSPTVATMLALATIYGANIGGMGSVTATPANGILVTYAVINHIPGVQFVSFASWLLWGIPLVIVFVGIAWLIISIVLHSRRYQAKRIRLPFDAREADHPLQKITLWMTAIYFISSFGLSVLLMLASNQTRLVLTLTGGFTLAFILFLFWVPLKAGNENRSGKQVLLTLPDCYNELPLKGFVFVLIAVVLAAVLYACNVHELFSRWAGMVLSPPVSPLMLFFLVALATSFLTEILSNTAVQLSFFVLALPFAQTFGVSALELLMIITLSCTSAYMSPIATGVNGLAFGGVKGVSLKKMLAVGFWMNLAGALLIAVWIRFIVGRLYESG